MKISPILLVSVLFGCGGLSAIDEPNPDTLSAMDRARFELGRDLFFDTALSGTGDVSCASCHDPAVGGAESRATSVGTGGAVLRRNAPSVFNAALKRFQFWDGRAETLEEQALGPLFAADEMGSNEADLERTVAARYGERMNAAFPTGGSSVNNVASALAAYQRMLPSPSRFDRFLQGETEALTTVEQDGYRLFRSRCSFCHSGSGIGGERLRVLGADVPWPADRRDDRGRFELTGDPADDMVFVVPSLRNVALTAPYFHDGSVETLDEAVTLMARHQLDETFSDPESEQLVAFLESLTAERIPEWAFPREDSTP